jgi:mxaJ protein
MSALGPLLALAILAGPQPGPDTPVLRVCADPSDLPFSSRDGRGLENRLMELLARRMGARVESTWVPQRRGFLRRTLNANLCDVVPGLTAGFERVATTRPYYRSTYVFVTRRGWKNAPSSLDSPALRTARVGITLVGDDGANPPAAEALARRGIVDNVRGYHVYADREGSGETLVRAVASGEIDVGILWGPSAAWFAREQEVPLQLRPVTPSRDGPLPFTFAIAMGVRKSDAALRERLDAALEAARPEVEALLAEFDVPRVPEAVR